MSVTTNKSGTHINEHGRRLDMIAATQHDTFVDGDYERLAAFHIRAVRDTIPVKIRSTC